MMSSTPPPSVPSEHFTLTEGLQELGMTGVQTYVILGIAAVLFVMGLLMLAIEGR